MAVRLLLLILLLSSCKKSTLHVVSVAEFRTFVEETEYITDAETYGWSIVQKNVFEYDTLHHINWRNPDGNQITDESLPVTQVSYNDAKAYSEWIGMRIPNYETYWKLSESDSRLINQNTNTILPKDQCNVIGNVWEITTPDKYDRIRLAGGSYLCSPNTCNGTVPDRILHVDKITGNSHIGMALIKD